MNFSLRISAASILLLTVLGSVKVFAAEQLLFANDAEYGIDQNTLVLDQNGDAATAVILQFGATINETLKWDEGNDYFEFSNDVKIVGGLEVSSDIDLNSNQLLEARIENAIDAGACDAGNTGRIFLDTNNSNQSYICDGTGWNQIDAPGGGTLDTAYDFGGAGAGRTITVDTGAVQLSGTGTVLQLGDGTASDVELMFTDGSARTLMWDDSENEFVLSDELLVSGDIDGGAITASGAISGDSLTLDGASSLQYTGSARPTRQVTLVPEYAGAVFTGDGSNNSGAMNSDFCENTVSASIPDINTGICNTAGDIHNYYNWDQSGGAAEDYDIWIRWRVPDNFSAWASNPINVYGKRTNATLNEVTVSVYDTAGVLENSGGTQVAGTSWTQTSIETTFAGTYTPGQYMTIQVHLVSNSGGDTVQVGEISMDYLSDN